MPGFPPNQIQNAILQPEGAPLPMPVRRPVVKVYEPSWDERAIKYISAHAKNAAGLGLGLLGTAVTAHPIVGEAINSYAPLNVRNYYNSIVGGRQNSPMTEKELHPEDIDDIRKFIQLRENLMTKGGFSDAEKKRMRSVGYGIKNQETGKLDDPYGYNFIPGQSSSNLRNAFGQFNYSIGKNGDIVIDDVYDFEVKWPVKSGQVLPGEFIIDKLLDTNSLYRNAINAGAAWGSIRRPSGQGRGRPMHIEIPAKRK